LRRENVPVHLVANTHKVDGFRYVLPGTQKTVPYRVWVIVKKPEAALKEKQSVKGYANDEDNLIKLEQAGFMVHDHKRVRNHSDKNIQDIASGKCCAVCCMPVIEFSFRNDGTN
jgi:non-homologous end joining protein Ku